MNTGNHGLRLAIILFALLAAAGSARAQDAAPAPHPPAGGDVIYMAVPDGGPMPPPEAIEFVEFAGGVGGRTVTGAPFTATISNQSSQTLPDGNHIQRNSTGTFSRDTQGRTRRDSTIPGFGPWAAPEKAGEQVSFINDPVAGAQYILDPNAKTARKFTGGKWKGRGKKHAPGGAAAGADSARPERPNVVTASLGTKTINGISAEGTQITRTIPAGAIGNEKPIVITVERWYSPDLQTVVMTKRSDPRTGDSTFQLTNIQRQEPDPSLFQVPADYTVKTGPAPGHRKRVPPPAE
ncbi:MAG TPA: hypothetical protein VEG64_12485 [Candidatus Sulfotelmatobacter sp.]|nr:hypothetical protein [Candidatus Sulfotelmatobacter sp.]